MSAATTIQGQAAELNEALDLPHDGMPGVEARLVGNSWRITGPIRWEGKVMARNIASGLDEHTTSAILQGMIEALEIAALRDHEHTWLQEGHGEKGTGVWVTDRMVCEECGAVSA